MKSDVNGTSTCPKGKEQFEAYKTSDKNIRVQYDYRTPEGKLFSTVKPTLKECREARDKWLKEQKIIFFIF